MDVKIKCYESLCELKEFVINGVQADYEDFGSKEDRAPKLAEPFCCANMQFISRPATQDVLDKYRISIKEYEEICNKLNCLSFGSCGWCS